MRVCYFGTYDTFQSRNDLLMQGLRAVGVEVVECHQPVWHDTGDKLQAVMGGWRSPRLWRRLVRAYSGLLRQAPHRLANCDAIVVGYAGQFDIFLAWPLARIVGCPLIFDAFNGLVETLVDDRRLVSADSIYARLLWGVDAVAGRLADAVLVDTHAHRQYFHTTFGIPLAKLHVLPAGADPVFHSPLSILHFPFSDLQPPPSAFRVLYFGQYIPLHGVNIIIAAAQSLKGEGVEFHLLGRGQTYQAAVEQAQGLVNVRFHHTWLSPVELLTQHILPADVCLGIFDPGPKAGRVIPHKVYVALAAGKPVITGDSPAAREFLTDGLHALLVPRGDPEALAAAVCRLRGEPALRRQLARRGRRLYWERFRPEVLGRALDELLQWAVVEKRERTEAVI